MRNVWIVRILSLMIVSLFSMHYAHAQGMGMMGYDDSHMMGGGYGSGMMGGGYGMGMMGGGYGMGMMGGGYGMGMMGRMHMLNLTKEQREKMSTIHREQRNRNIDLMKQMWDQTDKLRQLYAADNLDKKAIGEVYDRIFAIKRKMIDNMLDTHSKMQALLTKEQKEQLHKMPYGRMRGHMMDMR